MKKKQRRMIREHKTIDVMVNIYCHDHHSTEGLCVECAALIEYAHRRLHRCPFQENKMTCARCPIHCYKPKMRERVREVMRYAGPHMTYRHPILALFHFIDGFRKRPTPLRRKLTEHRERV